MKLVRMKIAGYRSLVDVDFAVRPLTVLIGPNGSGKTSLLDAFTLLRYGAQGELSQALTQRGGLNAVLPRVEPKPLKAEFQLEFQDTPDGARLAYAVQLGVTAVAHEVLSETVARRSREGHEARYGQEGEQDNAGRTGNCRRRAWRLSRHSRDAATNGELRATQR